jgi:SPP1 family predicted phage head-tail adaptor
VEKSKTRHRGTRIGDMRHRIYLYDRLITSPIYGSVDFDQEFVGIAKWAAIETINGKITFDSVGQDEVATHAFYIRFCDVSSQKFVETSDGRKFRIINAEDYEERHEYVRLLCTDRGLNEASKV